MDSTEYAVLAEQVQRLLQVSLHAYEPVQMQRRLEVFTRRHQISVASLAERLPTDAALLNALRDWITINVTEFFRDAAVWRVFQHSTLPGLAATHPLLRVWSAGCSNGAEPYSLAILLAAQGRRPIRRILATDIDPVILQRASTDGPYSAADLRNVPPCLRLKHFTTKADGAYVTPAIRARVDFQPLNLLGDLPRGPFDLIVCRNMIIYFEEAAKGRLLHGFHDALARGGLLWLGATESILNAERIQFDRSQSNFFRKSGGKPSADGAAARDSGSPGAGGPGLLPRPSSCLSDAEARGDRYASRQCQRYVPNRAPLCVRPHLHTCRGATCRGPARCGGARRGGSCCWPPGCCSAPATATATWRRLRMRRRRCQASPRRIPILLSPRVWSRFRSR